MAYTSDLPLSALSGEEKLFLERIRDLVTLCDQRGIPRFSAFLDERQPADRTFRRLPSRGDLWILGRLP